MLSSLLSPFVAASALGLVLSIVVHLCAWLNIASPLGRYTWLLHVGIFVVWFPTVLVSGRLTREYRANDFWKAALRGCPLWMRRMVYFFGAYAMLNFVIFILSEKPESPSGAEMPPVVARGFSGHWMVFYSAALATLYSAIHAGKVDEGRRCSNGHLVSAVARYCEQCGAPVYGVDS